MKNYIERKYWRKTKNEKYDGCYGSGKIHLTGTSKDGICGKCKGRGELV